MLAFLYLILKFYLAQKYKKNCAVKTICEKKQWLKMDFLINYVFSRRILVEGNRKSARKRGGLNSFLHFCI